MKDRSDWVEMILCLLLVVVFCALMQYAVRVEHNLKQTAIATPAIQLSAEEKAEFASCLVSYAAGSSKPIDAWIEKLEQDKRYGILPALPEGYTNPAVVICFDKWILCPPLHKTN